jgi:hypothetical protein
MTMFDSDCCFLIGVLGLWGFLDRPAHGKNQQPDMQFRPTIRIAAAG